MNIPIPIPNTHGNELYKEMKSTSEDMVLVSFLHKS